MAKRKIQIEIHPQDSPIWDNLQKATNSTITEILRNSIALYDWAVSESKKNRIVISVPEIPPTPEVVKPILKGINTYRNE